MNMYYKWLVILAFAVCPKTVIAAEDDGFVYCVATDYQIDAKFVTLVFKANWRNAADIARSFERYLNDSGAKIQLNDGYCYSSTRVNTESFDRISAERKKIIADIRSSRFKYSLARWSYSGD